MHNNDKGINELHTLVLTAERDRDSKHTTALKTYIDQHPQLSTITLSMTEEIREKLLFYVGNADKKTQEKLQIELNTLRDHLANLSEKPNVLHHLLCEEVLTSYLMLRCADVIYSRHHANVSTLGLRKMDTAQIRFLRALKTLASIQKLAPFINVNLGQQIVHN